MKKYQLILAFIVGILILSLTGCYTQLGTVKHEKPRYSEEYLYDEYDRNYQNDTTYYDDERTVINNYYYDGASWHPRHRWMFSYYYPSYYWPSVAFSYAYYDPWFYDRYWYYDPWICGTPWVYYGYYRPYSYYDPYYYWWGSRYYVTGKSSYPRTNRDFGSTRGQAGRRDLDEPRDGNYSGRGRSDLPTGVGVTGTGGRSQSDSPGEIRKPSRNDGSTRSVTPRTDDRSGSRRDEGTRGGSRRDRYERQSREPNQPQPSGRESGRAIEKRGSSERGSSRSEEPRSYSPPPPPASSSPAPAPAPAPSQPPARGSDSRGGSSDDNSSSRGGSTRGGR